MRLLLIDANRERVERERGFLAESGYCVDVARDALVAEELATEVAHDAVLVDFELPSQDGAELCRTLRGMGVDAPILLQTTRGAPEHLVRGLDSGADDVLVRPVDWTVLAARLRAHLRRARGATSASSVESCGVTLDLLRRSVLRDGRHRSLAPRPFALLELLMRRSEQIVTRTELSESVWRDAREPSGNAIEACVAELRRKVDRGFQEPRIHTVVRAGYRFGLP